jgi:hypothetical protein
LVSLVLPPGPVLAGVEVSGEGFALFTGSLG